MGEYIEEIEVEGHLVDSGIMAKILDEIIQNGCRFEITEFVMGRTNQDFSRAKVLIKSNDENVLKLAIAKLHHLGVKIHQAVDVAVKPAPKDKVVPDDFYSTTNHRTQIKLNNRWIDVKDQKMDSLIVVDQKRGEARVRKLRDIKAGDMVVCGLDGIKVTPTFKSRERSLFEFMGDGVSSERVVRNMVGGIAKEMVRLKKEGKKIAVVAGPVVIHTGGIDAMIKLIRAGYVDVLLSGNALAVHDIENALYETSLGVNVKTGTPVGGGYRHHMMAINAINRSGSIKNAVEDGTLKSGIMYECVKNNVKFVLAGSLRDDGPLPDVFTDIVDAQNEYIKAIKDVDLVIMLSTMLHSIATGNLLPSWVKTICVDINPAVVTKLSDRGTAQAMGIVTDVGLFLHLLSNELNGNGDKNKK